MKGTSGHWVLTIGLAAVLIGSGIGCQPAATTGPSPSTGTTNQQPDKDKKVKPPQSDPG